MTKEKKSTSIYVICNANQSPLSNGLIINENIYCPPSDSLFEIMAIPGDTGQYIAKINDDNAFSLTHSWTGNHWLELSSLNLNTEQQYDRNIKMEDNKKGDNLDVFRRFIDCACEELGINDFSFNGELAEKEPAYQLILAHSKSMLDYATNESFETEKLMNCSAIFFFISDTLFRALSASKDKQIVSLDSIKMLDEIKIMMSIAKSFVAEQEPIANLPDAEFSL